MKFQGGFDQLGPGGEPKKDAPKHGYTKKYKPLPLGVDIDVGDAPLAPDPGLIEGLDHLLPGDDEDTDD
eukprot:6859135-Pyramimonas_sp.AAC.1